MKRRWMVAGVAALALAGGLWALWPDDAGAPAPRAALPAEPGGDGKPSAAAPPAGQTLVGRVVDLGGRPIASARVLAAVGTASMADEPCDCDGCQKRLLEPGCPAAWIKIAQLVGRREGEWLYEREARTDAQGGFTFPGLPPRPLTVWAAADGYAPAFREGVLPGEPLVLALSTSFAVSGRVMDEGGQPLPAALVTALPTVLPRFAETTTGLDGLFRIAGLGGGAHYLVASAPGYLPAGLALAHAGPPEVTLTLPRPRALEGRVLDGAQPARGARVRLFGEHVSLALDAPLGLFRADGLAPGTWSVVASADRRSASKEVSLGPGTTRVELSLEDGLTARGRVMDEAGAPLAGAAVVATLERTRLAEARSGADGRFAVEGVRRGATLTASLPGYDPSSARASEREDTDLVLRRLVYVSGVVLGAGEVPAPEVQVVARGEGRNVATSDAAGNFRLALHAEGPVTLKAHHSSLGAAELSVEAPASDVRLRLSPLGALRARLVDRDGRPIAGGLATAWRERGAAGGPVEALSSDSPSGDDGVLVLAGLSQGLHRVRFTAQGRQGAERASVAVPQTGAVDLGEVVLEEGLSISGVVLQEDGSPAAGAFVHARARNRGGTEGASTGGDGAFALTGLKEGAYVVSAFREKSAVEAPARAGDRGVVLKLQAPARLRGRVLDEARRSIESFSIDGELVEAPDGRFEVPARAVREQVFFRVGAPGRLTEFRQARLGSGAIADAGDVVLRRSVSVEGTVQDERGAPIGGAQISALDGEQERARDDGASGAISRPDGHFRVDGLPAGPVALVGRRGGLVGRTDLEVPVEGEAPKAVLVLYGKGAIEGVIRAADGRPLPGEVEAAGVTATTDAQGRYRLDGVLPGPTTVTAFLDEEGTATRQVTVEVGQTARVDFEMAAGGALQIAVAGQASGVVQVVRADGATSADAPGLLGRQTADVVRGAGLVTGLPGGHYTVLFANEGTIAEGAVDVPARGVARIALTPRPLEETRILPPP